MNEVISVYTPGVIGCIEQFTLGGEELRQFVIYTYYNKDEEPLYVGCSKAFYDAHYFNSERLSFFEEVEYVGFFFFDNEADMKDARKYFIKSREPKYNQRKCKDTQLLPGLDPSADELVVSRKEMEQRWVEWLAPDDGEADRIVAEHEAEIAAWLPMVCSILKIRDRALSAEEEKYAWAWFGMGLDEFTVKKAYETTVIRTGSFSLTYMHTLLMRWKG